MKLADLGYTQNLEKYRQDNMLNSLDVGRVTAEHKERYVVKTGTSEYDAELLGNLRFTATTRADLPAVGDWVAISEYDTDKAIIHAIYPRQSVLERQAASKAGQRQIIATNIDFGLIIISVNRDFSINRLERYLAICHEAGVEPIIVVSKIDLVEDEVQKDIIQQIESRLAGVRILLISSKTGHGIDALRNEIQPGATYCLLGSSGVGKSTLLNALNDGELMATGEISEVIDRGRHVTSHRELFILNNGGIIIDNPGMREVGLTDNKDGLELTFDSINELASDCRFNDCSHINEAGCAILSALEAGNLDQDSYNNWQKLAREKAYFEANIEERRRKDKQFGKMVKNVLKHKKNNSM